MTLTDLLNKLLERQDLTDNEAAFMMTTIMDGAAAPAQTAGLLVALRAKGETVTEVAACARVMREKATRIVTGRHFLVDTCGTGGDGTRTFNISTAAALVAAGAGVAVAKHGNRSVSSASGSADVLREMGVNIDISPERVGRCIDETGIGFLFAPLLHQAMQHAVPIRRELGVRTVFNILGPLTNPAGAQAQVVGVFAPHLVPLVARVLAELGTQRALVVHGSGLDEITVAGETMIAEVRDGEVHGYPVRPEDFGLPVADIRELVVASPQESAAIIRAVLDGKPGPQRDVVVMNAAAAILAGQKADTFKTAVTLAAAALDSGQARQKLNQLAEFTSRP
jgi:anthranilate phosphoribosyltransferase